MTGLDTNVLIRYLAQDDPLQAAQATNFIERRLNSRNPGFLSVVVMTEAVWVLDAAYRLSNQEIAHSLERILQTDFIEVENEQAVFSAMVALRDGNGSFADALIGALGERAGCSRTMTFDRQAARLPYFELLK